MEDSGASGPLGGLPLPDETIGASTAPTSWPQDLARSTSVVVVSTSAGPSPSARLGTSPWGDWTASSPQ